MKQTRPYILWLALVFLAGGLFAQPGVDPKNRLEIISTDVFEFGDFEGKKIRKLIGNVHLVQDSTEMFCDSAYHYVDSNFVIAYSNVRIILSKASGREVEGNKLTYNGETKVVNIYNNVVLTDSAITLYTNHLTYYRIPDYGHYLKGGKIVNGENVMYSQSGYYYPRKDMTYFNKEVLLVNPDFLLETDTLGYQTEKEIAYFLAPTYIYDSTNYLYTEDGYYDTKGDMAYSYQNSQIGDTSYTLYADTIIYDENKDLGEAFSNVMVEEADSGMILFGQYGQFRSKTEESILTDQAFAIQVFEEDTLYLFADTLYSVQNKELDQKVFYGYKNALFFMRDFQGICDSITYLYGDSLLYFDIKPILWSDSSQITGKSVMVGLHEGDVDTLAIPENAFIVDQEGSVGFNQIKGKALNAKFKENKMDKMWIWGNSESIYFNKNEEKGEYIGMNNAKCTNMFVQFADNKPSAITFLEQPSGAFLPMFDVLGKPNKLDGFQWHEEKRPSKPDWLFELIYPDRDTLLSDLDSTLMRLATIKSQLETTYDFEQTSPEAGLDTTPDSEGDDNDDDGDSDEGNDNQEGNDDDGASSDDDDDDAVDKPPKGRKNKGRTGTVDEDGEDDGENAPEDGEEDAASDSTNVKKNKRVKKEKTFKNPKAEIRYRYKQRKKGERLERRKLAKEKKAKDKAKKQSRKTSKPPKEPNERFSLGRLWVGFSNFLGLQGRKESDKQKRMELKQKEREALRARKRAEKLMKQGKPENAPAKSDRGGSKVEPEEVEIPDETPPKTKKSKKDKTRPNVIQVPGAPSQNTPPTPPEDDSEEESEEED